MNIHELKEQIRTASPSQLAAILNKAGCQYCNYSRSELECCGADSCIKGIKEWLLM